MKQNAESVMPKELALQVYLALKGLLGDFEEWYKENRQISLEEILLKLSQAVKRGEVEREMLLEEIEQG